MENIKSEQQACKRIPPPGSNTCDAYKKKSAPLDYGCCKYAIDGSLLCKENGCSGASSTGNTPPAQWGSACKK